MLLRLNFQLYLQTTKRSQIPEAENGGGVQRQRTDKSSAPLTTPPRQLPAISASQSEVLEVPRAEPPGAAPACGGTEPAAPCPCWDPHGFLGQEETPVLGVPGHLTPSRALPVPSPASLSLAPASSFTLSLPLPLPSRSLLALPLPSPCSSPSLCPSPLPGAPAPCRSPWC